MSVTHCSLLNLMKLFWNVMRKDVNKIDDGAPLLIRGALLVRIDRLSMITQG
jgi:hypothetical protein